MSPPYLKRTDGRQTHLPPPTACHQLGDSGGLQRLVHCVRCALAVRAGPERLASVTPQRLLGIRECMQHPREDDTLIVWRLTGWAAT